MSRLRGIKRSKWRGIFISLPFLLWIQSCEYPGLAVADDEGLTTALAMKNSKLQCGSASITISTIQKKVDFNTGQAIVQIIRFEFGKKSKIYVLFYENNDRSDSMISEAKCASIKDGRRFVYLTSSNFGNCDQCEWIDYYSEKGIYLGSSQWPYLFGSKNFPYHELSAKIAFLKWLFLIGVLESAIDIDRTYP